MRKDHVTGMTNETMIRVTLDNHYFKDLSDKWKRHMRQMFPHIQDNDKIIAMTYPLRDAKPDLLIMVNYKKVYLSIKSGHSPQVHHEPIYTFYPFLEKLGVSKRILAIMKFYHYGASYMVGKKDNIIYSRDEILEKYPKLIEEVNEYFAANPEIVREIAYRAILKGRLDREQADFFYYGSAAKGFLLSTSDILKLVTDYPFKLTKTVSLLQLTYGPGSREVGNPAQKMVKLYFPVLCKLYFDNGFMIRYG